MIWRSKIEIDEKIHLEEHNTEWFKMFELEKFNLCESLGNVVLGIEHIGSTSIPDIYAKPIVDILIGVKCLPLHESQINKIMELDYEYLGETGVRGRLYFRKRYPQAYNVHITQIGSEIWNNNIILRDYLINHKYEANIYSDLKRNILTDGVDTLLEYSYRKHNFISELLKKANKWYNISS